MPPVVTRFAPSPTGMLHIGGARTALFNWLFARHHGGQFLLRIEDTDRERSTESAATAILDSLRWLELAWDGPEVYQSAHADAHRAAAHALLASGHAYRCYTAPEELEAMREAAKAGGTLLLYDRRWRERIDAPADTPFVVRLKMPLHGETVIEDLVQGRVTVDNRQLDDFVLLRSDGTPTYMLAVVVDDIAMGITHILRGDDHLNNAFRQYHLYQALGAPVPSFAHIPLIHGSDGAKLSKRHGALGTEEYRAMGYLPAALRNYLLRLGWGKGDTDILSTADAIALFEVADVGKAPSRLDLAKMASVNAQYLRALSPGDALAAVRPFTKARYPAATETQYAWLRAGLPALQERAKTLVELAEQAKVYLAPSPLPLSEAAQAALTDDTKALITEAAALLANAPEFTHTALFALMKDFAFQKSLKIGIIAATLRLPLTGEIHSPSLFEVMEIIGREETQRRLGSSKNHPPAMGF